MSKSVKMVSTLDAEKFVFIRYEIGWKNVKVYVQGKLTRQIKKSSELKNGITVDVKDFGTINLQLERSNKLKLSVDGISFAKEPNKKEIIRSTNGASIIFGVLGGLNVLFSLIALLFALDTSFDFSGTGLAYAIGGVVCSIIYITSAVYLRRGVYFFYFIGTVTFFATTIYVSSLEPDHDGEFTLWFVLPRWLFLALLLRYFNRVLQLAQSDQENEERDILDTEF